MRFVRTSLFLFAFAAVAAGPASWPSVLPVLRHLDPHGEEFTEALLKERGAVLIATAPNLSQGGAQNAWNEAYRAVRRDAEGPVVVLLEDMSQSWFRHVVLARMKESYRRGQGMLVLLDESGSTRRALGVPENTTVAFAFAAGGALVAVETGQATAERFAKLLRAAAGRAPSPPR